MSKKIAIYGAGGHGKVVGEIALLNNFEDIFFFDDAINLGSEKFPFKIEGSSKDLESNLKNFDYFFVAIGNNFIRKKKIEWLNSLNVKLVTLIHPNSFVSRFVSLGQGVCVMANVVLNAGVSIGDGVILNSSASIDHDCEIGNYAHISPNCSLSGGVIIGESTHIGTGTSIHPLIKIGKNVKTAVGSRVFKDLFDNIIFKN